MDVPELILYSSNSSSRKASLPCSLSVFAEGIVDPGAMMSTQEPQFE